MNQKDKEIEEQTKNKETRNSTKKIERKCLYCTIPIRRNHPTDPNTTTSNQNQTMIRFFIFLLYMILFPKGIIGLFVNPISTQLILNFLEFTQKSKSKLRLGKIFDNV